MTQDAPLVVIDPGHGTPDPGCTLTLAGRIVITTEAVQNLAVSLTLKAQLEAAGFRVLLTRTGAEQPGGAKLSKATSFGRRCHMTAFKGAFAYISVHHDVAKVTPHNRLGGVYYHPARTESVFLAQRITNMTRGWALPDTAARQGQLYVVRNAPAVRGVLWEVAPLRVHTKASRLAAVAPIVAALKQTALVAGVRLGGDRDMS